MSKKSKNFSEQEKAAIALKAAGGGEDTLKKLAREHNVSEAEIRTWIRETGAATIPEADEVSLEATEGFAKAVNHGVTFDHLNYRRLTFWTAFGAACLVLFIVGIMYMFDYSRNTISQVQSEQSRFYNIEQLKQLDRDRLNSFGLVDPDEGIYRIPIDSAITIIATD